MKKKLAKELKKTSDIQGGVNSIDNPDLLRAAEIQAGELYEGVTEDTSVDSSADYRMITKNDETVNSQGS